MEESFEAGKMSRASLAIWESATAIIVLISEFYFSWKQFWHNTTLFRSCKHGFQA